MAQELAKKDINLAQEVYIHYRKQNYLDNKIKQNEDMIIITFYELRIKYDLSEDETQEFLSLSKIRLENMKYQVYFTGAKYEQNGVIKTVQDNELMVAIKEKF